MSGRFSLHGVVFVWIVLLSLTLSGCMGGSSTVSKPTFKVDGVKDGAIYGHPVTPKVTSGPGSTVKKLTLNGAAFKSGTEIASSGTYKLEVLVQNAKGASATGNLTFTLALEVPVIHVTGVANGGYYTEPVTPHATTQNGSDTITAKLNGASYAFGTTIAGQGKYDGVPSSVEFQIRSIAPNNS